jgi:DnaJ-class molecular chaperone
MDECPDCDGSGSLSDDAWVACVFCDGSGLICAECGFSERDCKCEEESG